MQYVDMQHNWKTKDFLTEISNDGVILTRNLFRLSKHKGSEYQFDHFDLCVNWDDPHSQDLCAQPCGKQIW